MYRALAERYGWTPQQIAEMTPAQQLMMISDGGVDRRTGKPTVKFETRAQYEAFMRNVA